MKIRSLLQLVAIAFVSSAVVFSSGAAAAKVETKTETKPAVKNIKVADAAKLLAERKEVVVLDVRTPEEFKDGHLKGAVNLNIQSPTFKEDVAKLDKSKTYLVNCAAGGRSTRACNAMGDLGFKDALNLEGGFKAWSAAGQPVEKP